MSNHRAAAVRLQEAVFQLRKVLDWVAPLVDGRHDQWKADRLRKAIELAWEIGGSSYTIPDTMGTSGASAEFPFDKPSGRVIFLS